MLIYLKGISSAELDHVTDFLYNGEAFVTHQELKQFLETAQELQVKGLQGDLQGIGQKENNMDTISYQCTGHIKEKTEYENLEDTVGHGSVIFGAACAAKRFLFHVL